MDFHNMKRKDLQSLCKKHKIPANGTNLDMADRLASLLKKPEPEPQRQTKKVRFVLDEEQNQDSKENEDGSATQQVKAPAPKKSAMKQGSERSNQNQISVRVTRSRKGAEVAFLPSSPVEKKRPRRSAKIDKDDTRSTSVSSPEIVNLISPVEERPRRGGKTDRDAEKVSSAEIVDLTSPVEKKRTRKRGAKSGTEDVAKETSVNTSDGGETDGIGVRVTRSLRNIEAPANVADQKLKQNNGGNRKTTKEVSSQVEAVAVSNKSLRQTRSRRGNDQVNERGIVQEDSHEPEGRVTRHSRRIVATDDSHEPEGRVTRHSRRIVATDNSHEPEGRVPEESVKSDEQSRTDVALKKNAALEVETLRAPTVRSRATKRKFVATTDVVIEKPSRRNRPSTTTGKPPVVSNVELNNEKDGTKSRRQKQEVRGNGEAKSSLGKNDSILEELPKRSTRGASRDPGPVVLEELPKRSTRGASRRKSVGLDSGSVDITLEEKLDEMASQKDETEARVTNELKPLAKSSSDKGKRRKSVREHSGQKTEKLTDSSYPSGLSCVVEVPEDEELETNNEEAAPARISRCESTGIDSVPVDIVVEEKEDDMAGQNEKIETMGGSVNSTVSNVSSNNLTEPASAFENERIMRSLSGSYENNVEGVIQLCSENVSEEVDESSVVKRQSTLEETHVKLTQEDSSGNLEKINVDEADEKNPTAALPEASCMDQVREAADAVSRETPVLQNVACWSVNSTMSIVRSNNLTEAASASKNERTIQAVSELNENKVDGVIQLCPEFVCEDAVEFSTVKKQRILEETLVELTQEDSSGNLEKINVDELDDKDATTALPEESGMDEVREAADAVSRATPVVQNVTLNSTKSIVLGNNLTEAALSSKNEIVIQSASESHENKVEGVTQLCSELGCLDAVEFSIAKKHRILEENPTELRQEDADGKLEKHNVNVSNVVDEKGATKSLSEESDMDPVLEVADAMFRGTPLLSFSSEDHYGGGSSIKNPSSAVFRANIFSDVEYDVHMAKTSEVEEDGEKEEVEENADTVDEREDGEYLQNIQAELADLKTDAVSVMQSHNELVTYEQIQERIDEALEAISDYRTAGQGKLDQKNDAASENHFHSNLVSHEHINERIDEAVDAISDFICCANVSEVCSPINSGNKQNVATPKENHDFKISHNLVREDNDIKRSLVTEGINELDVNSQELHHHSNLESGQSMKEAGDWLGDASLTEDDENPISAPSHALTPCDDQAKEAVADFEENCDSENNLDFVEDRVGESSQQIPKGIVEMKGSDFQEMHQRPNVESNQQISESDINHNIVGKVAMHEAEFLHEVSKDAADGNDGVVDISSDASNDDSVNFDKIVRVELNSDNKDSTDEENAWSLFPSQSSKMNHAGDEDTPVRNAPLEPVNIDGDKSIEGAFYSAGQSANVVLNDSAREVVLRKPTFRDFFPIHFSSHMGIGADEEIRTDTSGHGTMEEVGKYSDSENVAEENVAHLSSYHDCVCDDIVVDEKEDTVNVEGTSVGVAQQFLQELELSEREDHMVHKDEEAGGCGVPDSQEASPETISSHSDGQLEGAAELQGEGGKENNTVPYELSEREINIFSGDGEGNEAASFSPNRTPVEMPQEEKGTEDVSGDKFEDTSGDEEDENLTLGKMPLEEKATEVVSVDKFEDTAGDENIGRQNEFLSTSVLKSEINTGLGSKMDLFGISVVGPKNTVEGNLEMDTAAAFEYHTDFTVDSDSTFVDELPVSKQTQEVSEGVSDTETELQGNTETMSEHPVSDFGGDVEEGECSLIRVSHEHFGEKIGLVSENLHVDGLHCEHSSRKIDNSREEESASASSEQSPDASNEARIAQVRCFLGLESLMFNDEAVDREEYVANVERSVSTLQEPVDILGDKEDHMVLKYEGDKSLDINARLEDLETSTENAVGTLYSSDVPLEQGIEDSKSGSDAYTLNEWEIDLFSGDNAGSQVATYIQNRISPEITEEIEMSGSVPDDKINEINGVSSESLKDGGNSLENTEDIVNAGVSFTPLVQNNGTELQEKLVSSPEGGVSIADHNANMTPEEEEYVDLSLSIADHNANMTPEEEEDVDLSLSMLFNIEEAEGQQTVSDSTPKNDTGKSEMDDINSRLRKFCITSALKGNQFRGRASERTPMRSSTSQLQSGLLASGMKENFPRTPMPSSTKLEQSTNRTPGKSVTKRKAFENLQNIRNR